MGNPINKVKDALNGVKKYWSRPGEGRYLSIKEIASFGAGGVGVYCLVSMMGLVIGVAKVPELYGIDPIHGTIIFLIASVAGLAAQSVFGKVLHTTKTKWGKYKPYLLFMAPLIGLLIIASAYVPQFESAAGRAVYVYLTWIPTLILFNVWNNLFNMMPAVITPNQQERTDMWAPIGLIVNFAPSIFNVVFPIIKGALADIHKEYLAYRFFSIAVVGLGIVLIFFILKVKERVYETEKKVEKIKITEGLKLVLKNKPLIILTIALMLGCLRAVVEMSSETMARLQYAETSREALAIYGALSMVVGFAATPNMILLPLLTRKFNNKTIILGWQVINTLAYVVLAVIGVGNLAVGAESATVLTVVRFFAAFNALGSLLPLMLSEIYDYQQWKTGKRLEGFIQTLAYSAVSLVSQVAMFLPVLIQNAMGYTPNDYFNKGRTEVPADALSKAINYYDISLWISVISGALLITVLLFYNLDKKKHAQIIRDLKERAVNVISGERESADGCDGAEAV
ncbi:MAG: MFS transporter [Clostridiales bacterium]|jgi:Na+/melibiose symporter-like transporter|nr:MFS transporter [Clostridiales bacterium]